MTLVKLLDHRGESDLLLLQVQHIRQCLSGLVGERGKIRAESTVCFCIRGHAQHQDQPKVDMLSIKIKASKTWQISLTFCGKGISQAVAGKCAENKKKRRAEMAT